MTKTICIFHGYGGNKPSTWLTSLNNSLQKQGYTTIYPTFPFMGASSIEDWFKEFKKYTSDLEEPVTIVGHSGGTTFSFYVAQHMNLHIDKMILAAPLNDQQGADYALTSRPGKESEISYLRNFIHQNFDFDTIKSKVNEFTFLLSDNDHLVPYEETRSYFEKIFPKAKFIKLHEYGHINEKAGITELPEVVNAITNETNTRS